MNAHRRLRLAAATALLLLAAPALQAQDAVYWVFLTDKGPEASARLATLTPAEAGLSDEAVARRVRAAGRSADAVLTVEDLPLYPPYLERIRAAGAKIRAISRWENAVSARMTVRQLETVSSLPCVRHTQAVRIRRAAPLPEAIMPPPLQRSTQTHALDYGQSLRQLEMIRVPKVHDVWVDGSDIIIGMLDNGYRWRDHEALGTRHILGEWDFINGDSLTENQPGDPPGQDSHGTATFSSLAGYREGMLIGPAYNASYYLAKTERNGQETQDEEDFWVEGIEWLEARGAAVASSSLAYDIFDDGNGYRYENGDFDGRTAVTTRAAVRAMRLGMVVVNAMGNEGNTPGTLMAPSDADSIVSVGAANYDFSVAGFSSNGPTNDSRIKPDVLAPGVAVFHATKYGTAEYSFSNGTSLATPLTAGVAALMRSTRPELTAVQVRDALRATADRSATPNSSHGWGVIDAWAALLHHGMVISTNPQEGWNGVPSSVAAYVLSPNAVLQSSVYLHYRTPDGLRDSVMMRLEEPYDSLGAGSGLYVAEVPFNEPMTVRYHISASDDVEMRSSPYGAPERTHVLEITEALPESFVLEQNYPNPFSSRRGGKTTIRYAVPQEGGHVLLAVYDMLGRRVRTLFEGSAAPGMHIASFTPGELASGPYTYALIAGETVLSRSMIIMH